MAENTFWQTHRPEELYNWCLSQPEIVERYKGQTVILHGHYFLGGGPDSLDALHDAEKRAVAENRPLPPHHEFFFVAVPERLWFEGEFDDPQNGKLDEAVPATLPLLPEQQYAWCLSQPDLVERYKGQVILLDHQTVLGAGRDDLEALEDAKRKAAKRNQPLPDRAGWQFVFVPEQLWFRGEFHSPTAAY